MSLGEKNDVWCADWKGRLQLRHKDKPADVVLGVSWKKGMESPPTFETLVLDCFEAKVCKYVLQIVATYSSESF